MTSGVDCVGRIVYCGVLAQRNDVLKVGDRVCSLFPFLGGNARFVSLPADHVFPVPNQVDASQATCIVRSYLAAIQILYRAGGMDKQIRKGDKVLVTGANGNLGRAVIELAKVAGAKVYASCRKIHKSFVLDDVGADVWLNEDPSSWKEGLSMDIIVDCVSFTNNYKDVMDALGKNGTKMVCAGMAKQQRQQIQKQRQQFSSLEVKDEFDVDEPVVGFCGVQIMPTPRSNTEDIYRQDMNLFPRVCNAIFEMTPNVLKRKVIDYNLFDSIEERPDLMADDLSLLFRLLETGRVRPAVAMTVGLSEVAKAHTLIEFGGLQGAVVCMPSM